MKPRHNGPQPSSEELRRDIDNTRGRLDETLDALGERLHPRHLLDDVIDYFRNSDHEKRRKMQHAAAQAGRQAVEEVRNHPVPVVLIAAGLAWRFFHHSADQEEEEYLLYEENALEEADPYEEEPYNYTGLAEPVGSAEGFETGTTTGGLKEQIQEKTSSAKEKAKAMKDTMVSEAGEVKEAAHEHLTEAAAAAQRAGRRTRDKAVRGGRRLRARTHRARVRVEERVQDGYERGQEAFHRAIEDHPLAVAAGFLGLGLIVGLALPKTKVEDRMMGDASDHLMETAKEKAAEKGEELIEQGKEIAGAVSEATTAEARAQGLTPGQMKDKLSAVAHEAKEAAQNEMTHHQPPPA